MGPEARSELPCAHVLKIAVKAFGPITRDRSKRIEIILLRYFHPTYNISNTIFFPKTVIWYFPSTRIPVAIQIGGFKDNFSIDCFQEMTFLVFNAMKSHFLKTELGQFHTGYFHIKLLHTDSFTQATFTSDLFTRTVSHKVTFTHGHFHMSHFPMATFTHFLSMHKAIKKEQIL